MFVSVQGGRGGRNRVMPMSMRTEAVENTKLLVQCTSESGVGDSAGFNLAKAIQFFGRADGGC